ncbi:NAD-P-binding protein [Gloeopeniophorella convolvens]|nr:NAD-P-binding protein [Gloeopeniophorella convolvens]
MSGYRTFAIAGAGNIGGPLIEQFLRAKADGLVDDIVVLSRAVSAATFDGTKTVVVDYADKKSLTTALVGVDVVISTVPVTVISTQLTLAAAAKEAGVQLFVPSEFSGAVESATEGFLADKLNLQARIKAVGPPTAVFYTGGWSDYFFNAELDLNITNGKISVGGDGSMPLSWTSRTDIARFVVYVLLKLPATQLRNAATFRCEGDRKSLVEIAHLYEQKSGRKVEIEYIPTSVLQERWKANPQDYSSYLKMSVARGFGLVGKPDNHLFPGWNPASVIDCIPVA